MDKRVADWVLWLRIKLQNMNGSFPQVSQIRAYRSALSRLICGKRSQVIAA